MAVHKTADGQLWSLISNLEKPILGCWFGIIRLFAWSQKIQIAWSKKLLPLKKIRDHVGIWSEPSCYPFLVRNGRDTVSSRGRSILFFKSSGRSQKWKIKGIAKRVRWNSEQWSSILSMQIRSWKRRNVHSWFYRKTLIRKRVKRISNRWASYDPRNQKSV